MSCAEDFTAAVTAAVTSALAAKGWGKGKGNGRSDRKGTAKGDSKGLGKGTKGKGKGNGAAAPAAKAPEQPQHKERHGPAIWICGNSSCLAAHSNPDYDSLRGCRICKETICTTTFGVNAGYPVISKKVDAANAAAAAKLPKQAAKPSKGWGKGDAKETVTVEDDDSSDSGEEAIQAPKKGLLALVAQLKTCADQAGLKTAGLPSGTPAPGDADEA